MNAAFPPGPPGVPPVNGICDTVTFVQYNVCHTIHSDISTTTKVSLCLLGLAAADFSFTLMLKIETWRLTILTNFLCGDKTLCNIHQPGYTRLVYIGSIATVNYIWTGITYGWNCPGRIFSPNIVTFFATLTPVFKHFLHWFYCFYYFYGSITCAAVGKTKFLTRHLR